MASPMTGVDSTDVDMLLPEMRLDCRGSITRHCKIGSSVNVSSFFGKTQTDTASGLSLGAMVPAAGLTLNMLHTDCGQAGVGEIVNL